jgi:transposase InsO family protein
VDTEEPEILIDDERYETKAIAAFLVGEIDAKSLQVSLGCSKADMYRLVRLERDRAVDNEPVSKPRPGNNALPAHQRAEIMQIMQACYSDFGPTFAAEKLSKVHGIRIGVSTLTRWMKEDGLFIPRSERKPRIFSSRKRRECRGELVQVDGSYHRWFEKRGPETCLLVFIDDATSELPHLRLVGHENSFEYMRSLRRHILTYGRPLALYSDKHTIFRSPHKDKFGERNPTQFARACHRIGIQVICANSPQAKGRVERANRTLQDRLVKEMRLLQISTIEEANFYLERDRQEHNAQFALQAASPIDAHVPAHHLNLDALLVYTVERKVFKDLSLSFNKVRLILEDTPESRKLIGARVTVAVHLEGNVEIVFDDMSLPYRTFDKIRRVPETPVVDRKRLGSALALAKCIADTEPHHFQRNNDMPTGFAGAFPEPDDIRSLALRQAPAEMRRHHRGRSRGKLHQHPVIVFPDSIIAVSKKLSD